MGNWKREAGPDVARGGWLAGLGGGDAKQSARRGQQLHHSGPTRSSAAIGARLFRLQLDSVAAEPGFAQPSEDRVDGEGRWKPHRLAYSTEALQGQGAEARLPGR